MAMDNWLSGGGLQFLMGIVLVAYGMLACLGICFLISICTSISTAIAGCICFGKGLQKQGVAEGDENQNNENNNPIIGGYFTPQVSFRIVSVWFIVLSLYSLVAVPLFIYFVINSIPARAAVFGIAYLFYVLHSLFITFNISHVMKQLSVPTVLSAIVTVMLLFTSFTILCAIAMTVTLSTNTINVAITYATCATHFLAAGCMSISTITYAIIVIVYKRKARIPVNIALFDISAVLSTFIIIFFTIGGVLYLINSFYITVLPGTFTILLSAFVPFFFVFTLLFAVIHYYRLAFKYYNNSKASQMVHIHDPSMNQTLLQNDSLASQQNQQDFGNNNGGNRSSINGNQPSAAYYYNNPAMQQQPQQPMNNVMYVNAAPVAAPYYYVHAQQPQVQVMPQQQPHQVVTVQQPMVYMYNNAASGNVPVNNEQVQQSMVISQEQQGNNGAVKAQEAIMVPSANSEVKGSNDSNAQLLDFNPSSL